MTTTRVALFHGPGAPLELREVAIPRLGPGEVLVAVRCCTLCGSDLHTLGGARSGPAPAVLGHEIVGTVEALGEGGAVDVDGRALALGERVVWSLVVPCGDCEGCARGRPQHCTRRFKYGHEAFADAPLSGGLARHCVLVRGTAIVRVPGDLDDALAATASCATATVAAALRAGGSARGDAVVVFGAGLLGLTAAAMAQDGGARHVTVVDRDPERARQSKGFGATDAVIAGGDAASVRDRLLAVQPGGFDLALELSGASAAAATALDAVAVGGRVILVGAVAPGPPIELLPERLVRRRARVEGVHNYAPEDLRTAIDFLARTRLPFRERIAEPLGLERVDAAVAAARDGSHLRVAVTPR